MWAGTAGRAARNELPSHRPRTTPEARTTRASGLARTLSIGPLAWVYPGMCASSSARVTLTLRWVLWTWTLPLLVRYFATMNTL